MKCKEITSATSVIKFNWSHQMHILISLLLYRLQLLSTEQTFLFLLTNSPYWYLLYTTQNELPQRKQWMISLSLEELFGLLSQNTRLSQISTPLDLLLETFQSQHFLWNSIVALSEVSPIYPVKHRRQQWGITIWNQIKSVKYTIPVVYDWEKV